MKNLLTILFVTVITHLGFGQKNLSQEDATNLLMAVPEVYSILVTHQNDSTVTNKLIEEPTEPNNEYYNYRTGQFFSYSEHTVTLWHFRINKTTKEIMVMDIIEGDYISLKEWKKQNLETDETFEYENDPPLPTILFYGLPKSNKYNNAKSIVADKWKIQFWSVGGCIVSDELRDSVRANNIVAYQQIEKMYGKDWREKFDAEVEQEEKSVIKAYELLNEQAFIKDLRKSDKWLDYMFNDKLSEGVYTVVVLGRCDWEGNSKICAFYELKVNIAKSNVEIVHDEKKLMDFE